MRLLFIPLLLVNIVIGLWEELFWMLRVKVFKKKCKCKDKWQIVLEDDGHQALCICKMCTASKLVSKLASIRKDKPL